MKHLTIVVPNGDNNLSSIVGAYKIFSRANQYRQEQTGQPLFTIQLAGLSEEVGFHDGLFSVRPHVRLADVKKTDLIILPSLNHNFMKAIAENGELVTWVTQQYRNGAEIASVCTGAFLLASTGLLEGMTCSTHWSVASEFKKMFPGIDLQTDKLITDENGIYTNGGAYSFLNLILYLVEKYFDRPTAIFCSKVFQVEMDRHSQSVFTIFSGQKQHGDEMVQQAQTYIESRMQEKISVEELCSVFSTGRRNFDRRFTKATGNTPGEYLQRVRIESAKRSLETTRKTVNEVMYEVGYADVKAFREVFRRITGMSPLEYRRRYNKDGEIRRR